MVTVLRPLVRETFKLCFICNALLRYGHISIVRCGHVVMNKTCELRTNENFNRNKES